MTFFRFYGFNEERHKAKVSCVSLGYQIGNSNKYMLFTWESRHYTIPDLLITVVENIVITSDDINEIERNLEFNIG